jgi:RHS repeat-associated protein
MRTLYDGLSFEVIREGETYGDGSFTTRDSAGSMATVNRGTEGSRYRWVSEGVNEARTRAVGEYGEATERYRGIKVTLYGRGEAVGVVRSTSTGSGTVYLGKDLLGSVKTTTGTYGSVEERYEYDVFGVPYRGDLTGGMDLGYTGKGYDVTTGLYNYGYRDYQPGVARFTTVDPVRDGVNWYAYVNNDPVNWIDPWGLTASDANGLRVVVQTAGTLTAIYTPSKNYETYPGIDYYNSVRAMSLNVVTNVVAGTPNNATSSDDNRFQVSGSNRTHPTQINNGTYNLTISSLSDKVNPPPAYKYGEPGNALFIGVTQMLEDVNTGKMVPDSGYMIHITPNSYTDGCIGIPYDAGDRYSRQTAEMRMDKLVDFVRVALLRVEPATITITD